MANSPSRVAQLNRLIGAQYRLIGSDGIGEVYEAENERTGGRVALKFPPPAIQREFNIAERFEQEARTAKPHPVGAHSHVAHQFLMIGAPCQPTV